MKVMLFVANEFRSLYFCSAVMIFFLSKNLLMKNMVYVCISYNKNNFIRSYDSFGHQSSVAGVFVVLSIIIWIFRIIRRAILAPASLHYAQRVCIPKQELWMIPSISSQPRNDGNVNASNTNIIDSW